mmetsp:Transcript_72858/g.159161  ORF Transcript_72858/g.159161 Transcript_72858/m.159161 type:complete len:224 (-) Transcript_72858:707-1378(-)
MVVGQFGVRKFLLLDLVLHSGFITTFAVALTVAVLGDGGCSFWITNMTITIQGPSSIVGDFQSSILLEPGWPSLAPSQQISQRGSPGTRSFWARTAFCHDVLPSSDVQLFGLLSSGGSCSRLFAEVPLRPLAKVRFLLLLLQKPHSARNSLRHLFGEASHGLERGPGGLGHGPHNTWRSAIFDRIDDLQEGSRVVNASKSHQDPPQEVCTVPQHALHRRYAMP